MKSVPDCIPDALSRVLETARMVSDDPFIHKKVLLRTMDELAGKNLPNHPQEVYYACFASACKALGVKDPYEKQKAREIKVLSGLEAEFRQSIDAAPSRIEACLNLLLAACVVSRNALGRVELEQAIRQQYAATPAMDERQELLAELKDATRVFYVLGLSNSLILDRLLVEEIAKSAEVTVVAHAGPVFDAATMDEAKDAGFDKLPGVKLVSPGVEMLGLSLERVNREFRAALNEADVVIARGEANYHALRLNEASVYFLFATACPQICAELQVPPSSALLLNGKKRPARPEDGE